MADPLGEVSSGSRQTPEQPEPNGQREPESSPRTGFQAARKWCRSCLQGQVGETCFQLASDVDEWMIRNIQLPEWRSTPSIIEWMTKRHCSPDTMRIAASGVVGSVALLAFLVGYEGVTGAGREFTEGAFPVEELDISDHGGEGGDELKSSPVDAGFEGEPAPPSPPPPPPVHLESTGEPSHRDTPPGEHDSGVRMGENSGQAETSISGQAVPGEEDTIGGSLPAGSTMAVEGDTRPPPPVLPDLRTEGSQTVSLSGGHELAAADTSVVGP